MTRKTSKGLYQPSKEHDSCGVGFIANLKGENSHRILQNGLEILKNLTHRGAVGADPLSGDGAGILTQIPDAFLQKQTKSLNINLPTKGLYAVGQFFMPQKSSPENEKNYAHIKNLIEEAIHSENFNCLGWREVPTDRSCLSQKKAFLASEPRTLQCFLTHENAADKEYFERALYILRKVISASVYKNISKSYNDFYVVSLSSQTIIYKGMFLADQLGAYYKDLSSKHFTSSLALVHQRFSTNTFPSWRLAHPFRYVAHNGEINTIRGNVNWMAARQASVHSKLMGNNMDKLWPVSYEGQSDTACFDNALEFLIQGGYSLPHAIMMMVPEAWDGNEIMDKKRHAFYEYHAALMEPWDGPAAITFTDGRYIGATLDRNGLRPARYQTMKNGDIILASEAGVLPVKEKNIETKWRLQPGKMLLIDTQKGTIISDKEIKKELSETNPYQKWVNTNQIVLEDMPSEGLNRRRPQASLLERQKAFGYTKEDINLILTPMAMAGQEAIGSMGTDTPLSVLNTHTKSLYSYFKQNFAQVTNPPIDPIREELVMSLVSFIGPRPNLFDLEGHSTHRRLAVRQPILTNDDLEKIRTIGDIAENQFNARTLDLTFPEAHGTNSMANALEILCERAEKAVRDGYNIIILSDRLLSKNRIAIPSLLATSGVHHHLIRKGLRTSVGLVVETGDAIEIHHFCVLAGYGAEAINPYLAFESLEHMAQKGKLPEEVTIEDAINRYIKAVGKGMLKVMSKMGISTYQSYCGAQIFDSIGLNKSLVDLYFKGTTTSIEGADLSDIETQTFKRHQNAFKETPFTTTQTLPIGGEYSYRTRGQKHMWSPSNIAALQHGVRHKKPDKWAEYTKDIDEKSSSHNLRGHLRFIFENKKKAPSLKPVPLHDVEPASKIVKRFSSGAMSFGSISKEAHETLALAMNALGGKSNTGEGGEQPERFMPLKDGRSKRSAIKQLASGRFGVTSEYLINADMIQIKVAQGAKPGEGGQLPAHKVDAVIANLRYSTPRVGLISPPPHHDIYSIEDLAQLIFDLKNINPEADISVKLVSEAGVGTVAAGVAKARADHITISGYDGGTGAAPLTSIKHAGSPWELGLSETHQTLVLNGLRSRITLQVDGGLKTARDVMIAALLGADEFAFATAPLIAAGCLMMRKCHLNTCPVGIATQDPILRKRFKGTPEHIINFFFYLAEDMRHIMAQLGARTLNELIGCTQFLEEKPNQEENYVHKINLAPLLFKPSHKAQHHHHTTRQNHPLDNILDHKLYEAAQQTLKTQEPTRHTFPISSKDRSVGAYLSGKIAKQYGMKGLKDQSLRFHFKGSAGQSFGAFLSHGVTFTLEGEANDYIGKSLSGGRLIIRPQKESTINPESSIIIGNTALYGAVKGEAYCAGIGGERFAVRNSGVTAVIEGIGDHGCEYMTGGIVVILGETGRNFAAGMSGGIAYVLDENKTFQSRVNMAMVDLEPIPQEDALFKKMNNRSDGLETKGRVNVNAISNHDEKHLFQLISNHYHYTASSKAKTILDGWHHYRRLFVKIIPIEYRRALEEIHAVQSEQIEAAE